MLWTQTHLSNWRLAVDPENRGLAEQWYLSVQPDAQPAPVPGIIQQVFPEFHGVAWYWQTYKLPALPGIEERILIRFGAVDYYAEVWVNGAAVGSHEGGETPFELDITDSVHGGDNLLAVRVINPSNEPIEGFILGEIPHRNKRTPHLPGSSYNYGGILLPVELSCVPAVRITDIFAEPNWQTGEVRITLTCLNPTGDMARRVLSVVIAPKNNGEIIARSEEQIIIRPGETIQQLCLTVADPHSWSIDTPTLYHLTVALGVYQRTVRFGFREFRVENGWFTLNGKRLFLKSTHTGNHFPIGQVVPSTPDLMRRDLLYAKACGYNCVRFIAGIAWPEQLDYCDEIGLMVYEETLAGWCLVDSPNMAERFDRSIQEMILRDRNHPSVIIWGLLNETFDGPVFRHAAAVLPRVRELDPSRLVLLGSGRWDCQPAIGSVSNPGNLTWEHQWGIESPNAEPVSNAWDHQHGGYFDRAGDAHVYPPVPQEEETNAFLRNLGRGTKPVFLSEYGIGSLLNAIGERRKYEEAGCRPDVPDYALICSIAEQFESDWLRWGFDGIYPFPEDMLRDSQRQHMRQRRLGFDLIRSNPRLCGYNLTGMLDHGMTGEGLWTFWRELKPGAADTLRDGWAPLRWCLFVTPTHAYTGRPVTLEAVLTNENVLAQGDYPATFRVVGQAGVVWEKKICLHVPQGSESQDSPFVVPVLKTTVQLGIPPGEYTFVARLDRGGAPAGEHLTFHISEPPAASTSGVEIMVWGIHRKVATWLVKQGFQLRPFTSQLAAKANIILIGKPASPTHRQWTALTEYISNGSTAIFLQSTALRKDDNATYWLPLAQKGNCQSFNDWLYHKECVAKNHPIFNGLPANGILDWNYYGPLISHEFYTGLPIPHEMICAAFALGYPCPGGYASGMMMGYYTLGAGGFVLNTLNILNKIDQHPAADYLLLNLIEYADSTISSVE